MTYVDRILDPLPDSVAALVILFAALSPFPLVGFVLFNVLTLVSGLGLCVDLGFTAQGCR